MSHELKLSTDSLSLESSASSTLGTSTSELKIFDLDKDFEELLDKLVMEDPVKRKEMLALPDASKKVLLEQQFTYRTVKSKSMSNSFSGGSIGKSGSQGSVGLLDSGTSANESFDDVKTVIASLVNTKNITIDIIRSLRIHLNTADRDWLKGFLDLQGVKPLLDILSKVFLQIRKKKKRKDLSLLQFECLRCLASLMHIKLGMEYIASYPQAANLIILALESPLVKVKTLAMELLAAIATTDKGHTGVITAMIYYKEIKKEDSRYGFIAKSLKSTNKEFLASCMSFINCVISSPADLQTRMEMRKSFLGVKIKKHIERLRTTNAEDKNILTQLDVFDEEQVTDEQLTVKELQGDNKSDAQEIFAGIYNKVNGTDSLQDLVVILLHLQRMYGSSLGNKVWKLYSIISKQLESELSHNPELDVSLVSLLFGPITPIKKSIFSFGSSKSKSPNSSPGLGSYNGSKGYDVDKMKKEMDERQKTIDHLLKQLNSFTGGQDINLWLTEREEKNKIIQELMKSQTKGEIFSGDAEPFKKEIQTLKLEIERLKHSGFNGSGSGTGTGSGGSGTGSGTGYGNGTGSGGGSGMGTGVGNSNTEEININIGSESTTPNSIETQLKVDDKLNTEEVIEIDGSGPPPPPPPPGMGGPPPPPPPPGSKKTNLRPPKPTLKPSVKMRNFNWVTIPVPKIENTFWDKVDEGSIVNQLDKSELEYLFAAKAVVKTETKTLTKKIAITIIDMKKANNCAIMLQSLKLGNAELKRIQSQMDEKFLTLDTAQYLLQFVPTKEDIAAIKDFPGDPNTLGAAEQYMMAIMDIPKLDAKLKAFIFKHKLPSLLDELVPDIKAVKKSSVEVKNSKKLQDILKYVLGIGNYINGSTNRGGAFGFKLETLAKMRDAKGNDGRMSVLHFLSKTIMEKSPELFNYHNELDNLEHASEVHINNIQSDSSEVRIGIQHIEKELQPCLEDPKFQGDSFIREVTGSFLQNAKNEYKNLEVLTEEMNKSYEAVTNFYGDSKTTPPDEFFGIFNRFLEDLDKAHKEYLSFIKKDSQEQKGSKYDDPEKGGFDDLKTNILSGKFFQDRRTSSNLNKNLIQQVQLAQQSMGPPKGPGSPEIPAGGFKLKPVTKQAPSPKPVEQPQQNVILKPSALRNANNNAKNN